MGGWKQGFVICVWFTFACGSCLCRFVIERNGLKVSSPENLKGIYECAISDFGIPEYGGTLNGFVVYPEANNQKACNAFAADISFKINTRGCLPVFLLVDRGDCYLTIKAWNAQKAGAAGILIANDRSDTLITTYFPYEEDQGAHFDYLQNITIPSALISKSLGDSIKKALENNDLVRVNLEWKESPQPAEKQVNHESWMNLDDECGDLLGLLVSFTPMWGLGGMEMYYLPEMIVYMISFMFPFLP